MGVIDRFLKIFRPASTAALPPDTSLVLPRDTSLVSRPDFIPAGFHDGIEILNGNSTPMKLVVSVLESHVGMKRSEAIRTMLRIHERGGVLLPTSSASEAKRIAEAISAEVAKRNHLLVCRAVTALAPSNQRLERP